MIRKIFKNKPINLQICEKCGATGNFKKHGWYKRYLVNIDGTKKIKIWRYRCVSCGTTHAIIPENVIPYKQYSLRFVILIFLMWSNLNNRNKYVYDNIPDTSRHRLINSCKKDACLLLSQNIDQNIIWKYHTFFNSILLNNFCIKKLNRKFIENRRLFNLKSAEKSYSSHFT